ncbi:MAG: hypothetical protein OSJ27_04035 [Candidatus Gastranaerophilales bacterium]|nr:hypothetical protein [Candidatus Gastranaerophilales bacterium]
MEIAPLNLNNARQGVNFKGKTPNIDDLRAIKRFANCSLDGLEKSLIESIKRKAPGLIQTLDGEKYIPDDRITKRIISGFKSFFGMPMDAIDSIARKFPDSKLNNAEFLKKYRASVQLDNEVRALQGIHKNTLDFVQDVMPEGSKYPTEECDGFCESICNPVTDKFIKKLNGVMADDVANYDTKKERFATRLISGFTAALFLGNDFYNKSIQKGKTNEEAKKEQHKKQGQEIRENICEAIVQFAVFACFSKIVNRSVWAPAIIGAAIGLVSRVVSRKASGMRITRMDVPESNNFERQLISMNEFMESVKAGNAEELLNEKRNNQINNVGNKKKKPVLSLKNILVFCALSIMSGYALRFGKKHTNKFNEGIIEKIEADGDTLFKLLNALKENGNTQLNKTIKNILNHIDKDGNVYLGTDFITTKKLFGIEVKVKDLKALKTAPFRFIKELVSYPYKIASKLEEAIRNSRLKAQGKEIPKKPELTEDIYGIKNLYKRFLEFDAKYGDDEKKLSEEFGKYIRKMQLASNNEVTSSKGNNSKIAVIAQTLGTLTGMWFNMNDEFNSSVRNGSTKEEAEKDARLRGINKFFRMTVQVIISGSLNDIFCKQYNNSIASSAAVVAASTVLTDMASRVLSGMPSKKMTKDELEKYQKDHKKGVMAWYYKMIDKLAS